MIFVSTSGVPGETIKDRIEALVAAGITAIELSGGTSYYPELENDLLKLKQKYDLRYLVHNYFPPPSEPFVFNLASLDSDIHDKSLSLARNALAISRKLGSTTVGFHAGFLFDIPLNEIGRALTPKPLFDYAHSEQVFLNTLNELQTEFQEMHIYLENNVLSAENYEVFNQTIPFFAVSSQQILDLSRKSGLPHLLDIAHLKVSSATLNLDFVTELDRVLPSATYIHLSDTDDQRDSNQLLTLDSPLWSILTRYKGNLLKKTITLEMKATPSDLAQITEKLKQEMYDT